MEGYDASNTSLTHPANRIVRTVEMTQGLMAPHVLAFPGHGAIGGDERSAAMPLHRERELNPIDGHAGGLSRTNHHGRRHRAMR